MAFWFFAAFRVILRLMRSPDRQVSPSSAFFEVTTTLYSSIETVPEQESNKRDTRYSVGEPRVSDLISLLRRLIEKRYSFSLENVTSLSNTTETTWFTENEAAYGRTFG